MTKKKLGYPPAHYLVAWAVHAFTASAACFGILTLIEIYQHNYVQALWFMGIAVFIDAVDGSLARLVGVKSVLPNIDGTLLDNIVDYLNYVITPCFFLFVKPDMLPPSYLLFIIVAIVITSAYQFCQADAKTTDHFFKGFPCYWNIAVFYMFIFDTSMSTNAWILSILCVLIFVPVKYVYPSRLDYLTESKFLKVVMHSFSATYGVSSAVILWSYPNIESLWLVLSIGYVVIYLTLSVYRTYSPMIKSRIAANKE
ncbi:phosphatidylcholine synthase [Legionella micdadei]|uniref:Phosphatidylcholine synthase n=1 Tax=Legionella micdadei TaxID=451 RepID=A0A098GE59_LEGMI|nr:CDP-alcohol phosphatidyltransferase family protein [Legionella micdadei]ARG97660.1 phosphatidylcholine synthase [Legionella micdadei]ARH00026.1 phosphatidylcholine synthase [Legionella micdadei]AYM51331.1 phosphatidylcholine synthase [Legionella micdadei]KTD27749.1 (CDP-alcohol) phosphatidyltransferase [Legionella micdadei]NSL17734.1 CDP-alcohol phosphatidyltransferase family protein [Legionella micdadei]